MLKINVYLVKIKRGIKLEKKIGTYTAADHD